MNDRSVLWIRLDMQGETRLESNTAASEAATRNHSQAVYSGSSGPQTPAAYARIFVATLPATSVSRKSRPA